MLNGELIRQRRRDLNMSHREVASRLRVTSAVIHRLEEGTNHEWITVGEVVKLASILAIKFGQMFSPEAAERLAVTGAADPSVSELGAFLCEMGGRVPRSALCQVFECSPDELDDALTRLTEALKGVGMTVHSLKDRVSITAVAGTDTESLKALTRSQLSRRGLTITDGNLLAEVVQGMNARRMLSHNENTALQRLRKAGIIDKDRTELSEDARASLLFE